VAGHQVAAPRQKCQLTRRVREVEKKYVDLGKIMNIDVENMGKNIKNIDKKVHPQKKRDMSQLANFEISPTPAVILTQKKHILRRNHDMDN